MGAMRKPAAGLSYYKAWGTDFSLTDKERKRCCRSKAGAWELAKKEKVDRPEYRKALATSGYYGHKYVYEVAGERCPDMEAGTELSRGLEMLKYIAIFNIPAEQIPMVGYRRGISVIRYADSIHIAMMSCKEIIGKQGTMSIADIKAMPCRVRSVMAAGYVFATLKCPADIFQELRRNRGYGWMVHQLFDTLKDVNAARKHRGLAIIASDKSSVGA